MLQFCRRDPVELAERGITCIQILTEVGMAATPRASTALARSGGCSRAASSHTSSLVAHSSQPCSHGPGC